MAQHLIDTDIEVAQCPRCQQYAFKAHHSGFAIAADTTLLESMEEVRNALLAGRMVHRVIMRAGRPWRLKTLGPGDVISQPLVADHACGIRPLSAHKIEAVPVDPQQAPVRLGGPEDGLHPRQQPASASQGPPAASATHHRSERQFLYRACCKCGELMGTSDPFGIMVGDYWEYVWHDPCPSRELSATQALSIAKDYTSLGQLLRQGLQDKTIETLELPDD